MTREGGNRNAACWKEIIEIHGLKEEDESEEILGLRGRRGLNCWEKQEYQIELDGWRDRPPHPSSLNCGMGWIFTCWCQHLPPLTVLPLTPLPAPVCGRKKGSDIERLGRINHIDQPVLDLQQFGKCDQWFRLYTVKFEKGKKKQTSWSMTF